MFSQNWFEAVVEVVMEKPVPPALVDSIIGIGWVNLDCLIVAEVEVIFERERAF